jgi:hypothetical protein
MIRKIGRKYVVLSDTTGRRFGTYDTLAAARQRLQQMEMFKHLGPRKRSGAPAGRRRRG